MKHIMKIAAVATVAALTLSGCFKDLDTPPIDPNVTQVFQQDGVFAKIYGTLGLTGIGSGDAGEGSGDVDGIDEGTSAFYRMQWELNEFPADDIWWVWGDPGIPALRAMEWDASNDLVKGLYARLYFDIAICNYFLKETDGLSDEKTSKQRAEVRFIRALNYYLLLDMYGEGVPFAEKLIDELPVQPNDLPNPVTRKELFTWLEGELKEIEPLMYADGTKTAYYRVDQTAVWLLLSRMYLNAEVYTGTAKWTEAAQYAGKVMSSSYKLAPVYRHLFMGDNDKLSPYNKASQEIILPIAQDGIQTRCYGGSLFLLAASHANGMSPWGITEQWTCMRAKSTLVKKFFPDLNAAKNIKADLNGMPGLAVDDRCLLESEVVAADDTPFTFSLEGGAGNGDGAFTKGWGFAKWSNLYAQPNTQSQDPKYPDMDIPYLRASEAYLTYAEAVSRGGTATNGTALDAVNELRKRANATEWTAAELTLPNLLDEWSREFYGEGRRRIDLVRHNKFAGAVGYNWEGKGGIATGKDVDAKYNIYPIPLTDLTANQNLKPSPGY
ncbi:MAG: RagB/SusD family nutrient uptake outer membrane protein [Prevotellaceae bacterium]|jgi:hypothetical protein|nr:RagB/SusD family nutrient uptake outer membrane protein [Prevotellaceae bacterium]